MYATNVRWSAYRLWFFWLRFRCGPFSIAPNVSFHGQRFAAILYSAHTISALFSTLHRGPQEVAGAVANLGHVSLTIHQLSECGAADWRPERCRCSCSCAFMQLRSTAKSNFHSIFFGWAGCVWVDVFRTAIAGTVRPQYCCCARSSTPAHCNAATE